MDSNLSFQYGANDSSGYMRPFEMQTPPHAFGGGGYIQDNGLDMPFSEDFTSSLNISYNTPRAVGDKKTFVWSSFSEQLTRLCKGELYVGKNGIIPQGGAGSIGDMMNI